MSLSVASNDSWLKLKGIFVETWDLVLPLRLYRDSLP
jgi:hypothetical protein